MVAELGAQTLILQLFVNTAREAVFNDCNLVQTDDWLKKKKGVLLLVENGVIDILKVTDLAALNRVSGMLVKLLNPSVSPAEPATVRGWRMFVEEEDAESYVTKKRAESQGQKPSIA